MGEWICNLILNVLGGIIDFKDDSDHWFVRFYRPISITFGIFSAIILVILVLCWIY